MSDNKIVEVEKRSPLQGLVEVNRSHSEQVALDFKNKARSVLEKLSKDYVIKEGDSEILLSVTSGDKPKFDTKVLHMHIKNLQRYSEDSPESFESPTKYALGIMNSLSGIAHLFPDKIPEYFEGYEVNQNLLMKPEMVYYPDKSIEIWQKENESLILFAIDLGHESLDVPNNWKELKEKYEQSKH